MLRRQYDNNDNGNKMFSSASQHHPFTASSSSGASSGTSCSSAHSILFPLSAAVGLVNHHDAITGTSKQVSVYNIYALYCMCMLIILYIYHKIFSSSLV